MNQIFLKNNDIKVSDGGLTDEMWSLNCLKSASFAFQKKSTVV